MDWTEMRLRWLLAWAGLACVLLLPPARADSLHSLVQAWAQKLGEDLADISTSVSRRHDVHESYKGAEVVVRNITGLLSELVERVHDLTHRRAEQTKRLVTAAERAALLQEGRAVRVPQPYVAIRDMEEEADPGQDPGQERSAPWLHYSAAFGAEVNETLSSVHVPTTVYDGSVQEFPEPEIQRAIKWTEAIEPTFASNLAQDRSTSWQYFAHHLGFMRQFPATKWTSREKADLFEARLRPWYLGATTSPKDVIVLLDNSGSMKMVEPKNLGRQVVTTILDTLGPDDYVNVLAFNDKVQPLIPGIDDRLISATIANVRELRSRMDDLEPEGVANFSTALRKAFVLLEEYRRFERGAACNQAIMLVTDGVPFYEQNVFAEFNWHNSTMHVRIFTYLVGDAEDEAREAKWMACVNKGWHQSLRQSQHDRVLSYIPVMARPLVLQADHPIHWTHMYADVTDPEATDYLWQQALREQQKKKFVLYCTKHLTYHPKGEQHYLGRLPIKDFTPGQHEDFTISISIPVYNTSLNGTKNGELLGVAGIDIPIRQIQKMLPQHKVGVNSYVFMLTNNGFVIFHPDLRPTYNGILKPGYNSVDMAEVELEHGSSPRFISPSMRELRQKVVNQFTGSGVLAVNQPFDNMRRVFRLTRRYVFKGVEGTPYSLVIAVPEDYGRFAVRASEDIFMPKVSSYFGGEKWRLHPKWTYCENSDEARVLAYLRHKEFDTCDMGLLSVLAYDARVTQWFSDPSSWPEEVRVKWERWNVTAAFLATRSGLTRWQTFPRNSVYARRPRPFAETRGPDETWYRRAVDRFTADPHGFVYSVPHAEEPDEDEYSEYRVPSDQGSAHLVTVSAAVFLKKSDKVKAPAAVVGFQFLQSKLQALFNTVTAVLLCHDTEECSDSCASPSLDCFLVDEHGVVVAGETGAAVGRPLGRVNRPVMEGLVQARVFQRVHLVDCQAICRRPEGDANAATSTHGTLSLLAVLAGWAGWAVSQLAALSVLATQHPLLGLWPWVGAADAQSEDYGESPATTPDYKVALKQALAELRVNKTRLEPCDMGVDIFHLRQPFHAPKTPPNCERPFSVAQVPGTNLVLVVVLTHCGPSPSQEPDLSLLDPSMLDPSLLDPDADADAERDTAGQGDLGDVEMRPTEELYVLESDNRTVTGPEFIANTMQLRRRPTVCYKHHVGEQHIVDCGRGSPLSAINSSLIWVGVLYLMLRDMYSVA